MCKPSKPAIDLSYYVCTVLAIMAPLPFSHDSHSISCILSPSLSSSSPHLIGSITCSCHSYPASLFFFGLHLIRTTVHATALTSLFVTPFGAFTQILSHALFYVFTCSFAPKWMISYSSSVWVSLRILFFFFPPLFLEQDLNFYEKLSCGALIMEKKNHEQTLIFCLWSKMCYTANQHYWI